MQGPRELPGRDAGVDGLIALADMLGDVATFGIIRRCRTMHKGDNPGGATLAVLARRMVQAEPDSDKDWTVARGRVARRLGYKTTEIPNFTRILEGPDDGGPPDEELLELAREFGDAAVFDLIRLCRNARGAHNSAGAQALHILAKRMVDQRVETSGVTHLTAVKLVAERLGYTGRYAGNGWANFAKLVSGYQVPEGILRRPTSRRRGKR